MKCAPRCHFFILAQILTNFAGNERPQKVLQDTPSTITTLHCYCLVARPQTGGRRELWARGKKRKFNTAAMAGRNRPPPYRCWKTGDISVIN